ncbi:MAG: glutamine-hydrolyzing carbamoyl-phosphate synthase small subunit [Atopobiaceae bacterium]|jgi:carbamoyl-phosphate synthase small subunit|nr:glutamine-hydrolyzing carbamoyl-phosphate synthase small subunit [Atopobiaceae bacterium]MCI1318558.1 glutamine-hydrolyzing carbamoyl-phosphate synthase small subunit [Atopobiaceae bacterium]MCI1389427.1 glutamine-hydrolyzing carbamoyl-phosphate synthase small subunit [Atopobiaceae bacterium]MCI1432292.1 glutamine-hydrolyzing carbamoyl-phosphate synthase small subunit [Atopobiaceae bacterium]MCI1470750.1 glutamine-hydrolyzing carbamoyl-phosphate synthase small subunit [Atopobiaceae bacterium
MNQLLSQGTPKALLVLEDGTAFEGRSAGAEGEAFGEVVFNTSLSGYQEVVSDPSYAGQIVAFTYPQIGNYGVCKADMQAEHLALKGVVVRDMCRTPSNWRSEGSLPELLAAEGVVAIEGVDTRALTLRVRESGTMRAAISTTDLDREHLLARVRESPSISERNYVADVSCAEPYQVAGATEPSAFARSDEPRATHRVVALDCGEKRGILAGLAAAGLDVTVVPWDTTAEQVLAYEPEGVFLSNGPGDPRVVPQPAELAGELLGKVPLFGICLGHQMICQAAGATIEKLPYGHHGGNQPVMNLLSGMVEITAQNHNYGLDFASLGPIVPELSGGYAEHEADLRAWSQRHVAPVVANERFGRIRLTHVNLNDGTPEGIQFLDLPAFSVQYHPEASPGPHDSAYLFEAFRRLVEGDPDYLAIDVREGRRF